MRSTSKGHILVADDDPTLCALFRRVLELDGYQVATAGSAPEVLRALDETDYDLLVSDVRMPGNDGLAVLHGQSCVPVLLVTGDPDVDSAVSALRGSAIDYLTKPVGPEQLLERVAEGVSRGRTLRTLRESQVRLNEQLEVVSRLRRVFDAPGDVQFEPRERTSLPASLADKLTEREREILLSFGRSQRLDDIAEERGISINTVKNHLRSIYRKLGVSSRVELVQRLEQARRH